MSDDADLIAGEQPVSGQEIFEPDTGGNSSGLIRAAIFGVLLFLAVIGLISVVNTWIRTPATEPVLALSEEKPVETEEEKDAYVALKEDWVQSRALLESERANKVRLTDLISKTETSIGTQKELVKRGKELVDVATTAAGKTQDVLEERESILAEIDADTPTSDFETAELMLSRSKEAVSKANSDYARAQKERARIQSTVTELRNASKAAKAAAEASKLVVAAAASARQAVNENQDVMAEADEPTLSNLENDFFADAQEQSDNAQKSADAAQKAVTVAELRLNILEKQQSEYQSRLAEAQEINGDAEIAMAQAQKNLNAHLKKLLEAEKSKDKAAKDLKTAQDLVASSQADLTKQETKLGQFQEILKDAKTQVARVDTSLQTAQSNFLETETELKQVQRKRAQQAAIAIAAMNAELNEQLADALGRVSPDLPVFDRFVLSSERLFETGSAVLGASGKQVLQDVVPIVRDVVKQLPENVEWVLRVDGHTDAQPLSGSGRFRDNWELSQARALAVVKYLISASDLEPRQLSANGFGEYQPLSDDISPVALAKNRRIELTLAAR